MSRTSKAALLFFVLMLCGSAFLVAHKLRERLPPPAPHELFAIVNEQLSALRADDYRSAYRFAATGVQQKFTPAQFEKMVRRSFPELGHARRVEFGAVQLQGGNALVQVFFFAADESVRAFVYSLIEEGDSWKIDRVEEVKSVQPRATIAGTHA